MYHFDWSEIRTEVKDTVLSIEQKNYISSQYTRYYEKPLEVWSTEEWFITYAKTPELVQLLQYDNTAVKGLVFQSLLRRKDSQIFEYVMNSLDDEDTVYLNLGCIGGSIGVTEYYLSFLGYYSVEKNISKDKKHLFSKDQIKTLDSIASTKRISFYN
jgi:hypothetical protein